MILVIGENITDIFIYCSSERLSPECPPAPVLKPIKKNLNSGGAANVVENLKSLGGKGVVGIHQKSSIVKTRYIVGNQHVMRLDENDECESLLFEDLEERLLKIGLKLNQFEGIVISSYSKGFIDPDLIINIRNNYNGLIFVDTKDKKGPWCESVDFIKINEKEWRENFQSYDGLANIFVTKGEKGVWWVNENLMLPVEQIEVVNPCGCGDSFMSGLVVEYLNSKDIKKSLDFANRCARFAASKNGVVSVKKEEV